MRLYLPSSVDQLDAKRAWFTKSPAFQWLAKKGVIPGFELKGDIAGMDRRYPMEFGVHLPSNSVEKWLSPQEKRDAGEYLTSVKVLYPRYTVIHGLRVGDPLDFGDFRYMAGFGPEDYAAALDRMIEAVQSINREYGLKLCLENTPLTSFMSRHGSHDRELRLDMRIGSLSNDMRAVSICANCGCVLDLEHLAFACDFLRRRHLYSGLLPPQLLSGKKTALEKITELAFGFFLRRGEIPYSWREITASHVLDLLQSGTNIVHLSGTTEGGGNWVEMNNGKKTTHAPIEKEDALLERVVTMIYRRTQGDVTLVLEASGHESSPCRKDRPADTQQQSFENLCEMLLDIIG